MTLGLAPLAAFSFFLKSRGLPLLPLSVLMKGGAVGQSGPLGRAYELAQNGIRLSLDKDRAPMTVLFLIFLAMTLRARTRQSRLALTGATLLAVLQLTIGRFNWFHRYEVYAVVFLATLAVGWLTKSTRIPYACYAAALAIFAVPYVYATFATVTASTKIYRQQYQMHRFVTDFYTGNYAVNDLGWASYQRRPGSYVLDIFGLGSVEAALQKDKSAVWLRQIAEEHQATLAMIYPEWFGALPESWTPVATMCEVASPGITNGLSKTRPCMVYYSTAKERAGELRQQLRAFAKTLPEKVTMRFEDDVSR